MSYSKYASYYDLVEGEKLDQVQLLKDLIHKHNPHAKTILELACGTGTLMKGLIDTYSVEGLDNSQYMLNIARTKLPKAELYSQSMDHFSTGKKYDVILCIFDSLNHLLTYDSWVNTFKHVSENLNNNGIFICDYNPIERLAGLSQSSSFSKHIEDFEVRMSISQYHRSHYPTFKLDIQIYKDNNIEPIIEDTIHETSFPQKDVVQALEKYLSIETIGNPHGEENKSVTDRVWIVAKKQ